MSGGKMKATGNFVFCISLLLACHLSAATFYVSSTSKNPTVPYNTWATAATNIQAAVDAASAGSLVLVSNGTYSGGLILGKTLTLLSVHGASVTIIDGGGASQCLAITNIAIVSGFTLTHGFATNGGGVYCDSTNAFLTNCVISGNSAAIGGGAYGGTLYDCLVTGNTAKLIQYGLAGGTYGSMLYNCTVSGNSSYQGGGAWNGLLYNSVIYGNTAQYDPNFWSGMFLDNCCTTPMPTNGVGNITNAPLFVDQAGGDYHLQAASPCVDAGDNIYVFTPGDLDGQPRVSGSSVDMGAYEFQSSGPPVIVQQPQSQGTYTGGSVVFTAAASGSSPFLWQWLFNGQPISRATNASLALSAVSLNQAGAYSVLVTNALGNASSASATLTVWPANVSHTLYVSGASPTPTPPFTNWATAAHTIQDAVDAALAGDTVLVTNGVYGAVAVQRSLTLVGLNGATSCIIDGGGTNRCLVVTNQMNVSGFTLTNGWADNGGALWCRTTNSFLTNCVLIGNSAAQNGGGAYGATLYNCVLKGNSAPNGSGGGSFGSMLYGCTVTGNSASSAGGARGGILYNSIIYYNTAGNADNYLNVYYLMSCCTTPMPVYGAGNITDPPLLVDAFSGNLHLQTNSPCIDAGNISFLYGAVDLDGNPRVSGGSIDIGAYELQESGPPVISVQPPSQTVYAGNTASFNVSAAGQWPLAWQWLFNGTAIPTATNSSISLVASTSQAGNYSVIVTNTLGSVTSVVAVLTVTIPPGDSPIIIQQPVSQFASPGATVGFVAAAYSSLPVFWQWLFNGVPIPLATNASLTLTSVTTAQSGAYSVIASNELGTVTSFVATLVVRQSTISYVWQDSPDPAAPYTNWATAAHVIQDAVDQATPGDEIVVTNGLYAIGGRTAGTDPTTNRVALDRPLTLRSVNGADVTIIQGYQVPGTTNGDAAIRCLYLSSNIVVTGFTLTNGATRSSGAGGGVFNSEWPGGLLKKCKVIGNAADQSGGGAFGGACVNCLFTLNIAGQSGGGTCFCGLTNCTVVANSAGQQGGGGVVGTVINSIMYYNTAPDNPDWTPDKGGMISFSCTPDFWPVPQWQNIIDPPLFVDQANGNFHLQAGSPCINAASNQSVTDSNDLDGNPRIVGASVDIGAYEFQNTSSVLPMAWLQQYGLPTDGSADFADSDGDGMNNWQEWLAGTCPTNAQSVLRLLSVAPSSTNVTVSWQSVAGVNYFLQKSAQLNSAFALARSNMVVVVTNIIGQSGTTSFTDTNGLDSVPIFYRVGVTAP
jgi:hypothetical protein